MFAALSSKVLGEEAKGGVEIMSSEQLWGTLEESEATGRALYAVG